MEQFEKHSNETIMIPTEAGQIKTNEVIIINGQPFRVSTISKYKPGKHGCAKCTFMACNIFNGKKTDLVTSSSKSVDVPVIVNKNYILNDIDEDGYLKLIDDNSVLREDLKLPLYPETMAHEIKTLFDDECELTLTVTIACGNEQITAYKKNTSTQ
jgi:translation initiation factor 5A